MGKYSWVVSIVLFTSSCQSMINGGVWEQRFQQAIQAEQRGNVAEALPHAQEAYELAEETFGAVDKKTLKSADQLSKIYARLGRFSDAEQLQIKSLELSRAQLGETHRDTLSSMSKLSSFYLEQGRYGESESLAKQLWTLRRESLGENHADTLGALNNLAALYEHTGRYDDAEPILQQVVTQRQQLLGPRHSSTLISMLNLGMAYDHQGRFDDAEALYQHILQVSDEDGLGRDPATLNAMQTFGRHYALSGRYQEAETFVRQALDLRREIIGEEHPQTLVSMYSLASIHRRQGKHEKADEIYRQALPLTRAVFGDLHPDTLQAELGNIFNLALSDRVGNAVDELKRHATYRLAYAEAQLATTTGTTARSKVLEQQSIFQDSVITFGLNNPRPEPIDLVGEVMLGWKQVQGAEAAYVAHLLRTEDDRNVQTLAEEIAALRAELAALVHGGTSRKNPVAILEKLEEKELALSRISDDFQENRSVRRASLSDLQNVLPDGSAAIEFRQYRPVDMKTADRGEPRFAALLIRPDQPPKLSDVGSVKLVERLLTAVRNDQLPDRAGHAATELYKQLFSPFADDLEALDKLYIAPDGLLHLLPFDQLRLADGRYWGERLALRFLPTSRDLMRQDKVNTRAAGLLALGGVDFDGIAKASGESTATGPSDSKSIPAAADHGQMATTRGQLRSVFEAFDSLPASKNEVWQIERIYREQRPDDPVTVWTGLSASEARLKKLDGLETTPRVVHIATHGFYLPGSLQTLARPQLYSGLVLAGANRALADERDDNRIESEDGILYSLEAQDLNLDGTELVVLSACDTGKGVIDYSEGIVGMVQALRIAGAKQVLVTLWPVLDKPTAAFMETFYSLWLTDRDQDPAAALDATKELFRHHNNPDYRRPLVWAPFILIG